MDLWHEVAVFWPVALAVGLVSVTLAVIVVGLGIESMVRRYTAGQGKDSGTRKRRA